jgi:mevalonate kinase
MVFHFNISRGSGYDVACANAESALLYQLINEMPVIQSVDFQPDFMDKMYLVYLGQKQDTSKSVAAFLNNYKKNQEDIDLYSKLTCDLIKTSSIEEFGELIIQHEKRLSEILNISVLKEALFSDLDGYAKSLGAWGGDFALLICSWEKEKLSSYLSSKGITQWFAYNDLVL